ncbi:ras and EF-hand domain-containing protein isoform X2 [Thalassophryne amazonica]|uniref:ras and EF-hand domain-containing protein isoform X2 n=1 Tax=Thalassophryne amazonica TaxID=390379 RepID=UPI0014718CA4|nr:ras and EF-hand domain-containing protein isoform X2 [Thalassophryne amazonica]
MEEKEVNGLELIQEANASDWGHITLLDKTKEFFQTCDTEGKGFITRTDMRRLHRELPLSAQELEEVFDSLDTDHAGYLTLETFSSGFSHFLHGRRISLSDEPSPVCGPEFRTKASLYQSQWDAKLAGTEDEEERHFSMLLDSLGASNVFEDPGEVRTLWTQLRRVEPHLLSNFEEFLSRVTHQIKEAHQEKKEMESALQRKAATHNSEIRHLYEEMEAQIKTEKDRLLLKDSERLQVHSQDLERQLFSKEKELEHLFQNQKRLELQYHVLSSEKQESLVENLNLKLTNDKLSQALEATNQELALAQEQLNLLQEQASRLIQDKEIEMYRVTEGLQREKQSLMKHLDLLREMNKDLKDERDMCCAAKQQQQRASVANASDVSQPEKSEDDASATTTSAVTGPKQTTLKENSSSVKDRSISALVKIQDVKSKVKMSPSKNIGRKGEEEENWDTPCDGWQLRRVISIEEDHLPDLLQREPQPLLLQLSEGQSVFEAGVVMATCHAATTPPSQIPPSTEATPPRKSVFTKGKRTPISPRGQPVGKEADHKPAEGVLFGPDRLFKVVLVGNSSVGKTSLLRSFCQGWFHSATTPTVGVDYSVKTLILNNVRVAMQLWDTAGQERYRSITKQFFRKADGVVVMYDITAKESFKAVKSWLAHVQSTSGEGVPILLLGNKVDMGGSREVLFKEADLLAYENNLIFYEVSAYTNQNVAESFTRLARVLMEQEDKVRDKTVVLKAHPGKKNSCCS